MDSLPSIPSEASMFPEGCQQLGRLGASVLDAAALRPWTSSAQPLDLLLVLAAIAAGVAVFLLVMILK